MRKSSETPRSRNLNFIRFFLSLHLTYQPCLPRVYWLCSLQLVSFSQALCSHEFSAWPHSILKIYFSKIMTREKRVSWYLNWNCLRKWHWLDMSGSQANHQWIIWQARAAKHGDRPFLAQMSPLWPKDMSILFGPYYNHRYQIEETQSPQKGNILLDNKKVNEHDIHSNLRQST